jgi:hypothetical protein
MDCGTHENDLKDLAAETIAPGREAGVRAHLEACLACREKFAEEKLLLEMVDAALKEEMNAAAPAGLPGKIRAAARKEADRPAEFRWRMPALAVAGIAFAVMMVWRGTNELPRALPSVAKAPGIATPAGGAETRGAASPEPRREYRVRSPRREAPLTVAYAEPGVEVLVRAGEEEELRRWIALHDGEILAEKAERMAAADKPLEIAPLEVAQLEIKPLGEERQPGTGKN